MAGLSKQHFNAIAEIIKKNITPDKKGTLDLNIVVSLADYFKTQNPLFNNKRFIEACLK